MLRKKTKEFGRMRKKSLVLGKAVIKFCDDFSKGMEKKSIEEFLELIVGLDKRYAEFTKNNMTYWTLTGALLEEEIRGKLSKFNNETQDRIMSIMSRPEHHTYLEKQEDDFKKLVMLAKKKGIENVKQEIKSFSAKYFWFPYECVGPSIWDEESVTKKIILSLNEDHSITEKNAINEHRACIKKHSLSKDVQDDFKIVRFSLMLQDDRKQYNSHACYYYNHLILGELSKKLGLSLALTRYIDADALKEYIRDKNISKLKRVLEERSRIFCTAREQWTGKHRYIQGEEAKKFLKDKKIMLEEDQELSELKGQSVYPGIVSGKAKIVRLSGEVEKLEPGSVLITGMTTPDYLPLIKQSIAIVTDEGGLLCHAAIVARELKKPCVIGTKLATKAIKDGDVIEVDADNGIVRKL
jgi:phosphohistidine swiveling domain-containing protein